VVRTKNDAREYRIADDNESLDPFTLRLRRRRIIAADENFDNLRRAQETNGHDGCAKARRDDKVDGSKNLAKFEYF
jgi:hypothetical protein